MTIRESAAKSALPAAIAAAAIALAVAAGFVATPRAAELRAPRVLSSEERAQLLAEAQQRPAAPVDPAQFDKYVGFYQLDPDASHPWPYTFILIMRQGGHLYAQWGEHLLSLGPVAEDAEEIFPQGPTQFFARKQVDQITFIMNAKGKAAELTEYSPGFAENRARKVGEPVVRAAEAALTERIKNQKPNPGAEAALRRYIAGLQSGRPDYAAMTPIVAFLARLSVEHAKKCGALTSLTFVDVNAQGRDEYRADYENARMPLIEADVTPDGKYSGQATICR